MFTLTIETDNAAFEDDATDEVRRILMALSTRVAFDDRGMQGSLVLDSNGNTVGSWRYVP
jgi:hypothetical protein